jgi:hypothetical protein
VLCRLALLHRDPEYLQSSVTASEADYQADAARTLAALAERYQTLGVDAAVYGVALGELQALG